VRKLKLILALWWAVGLSGPGYSPALAQSGLHVEIFPAPEYTFGKVITFRISASSSAAISQVTLFYRVKPAADLQSAPAIFAAGQDVTGLVTLDLESAPWAPFTEIDYWWEVQDAAQNRLTTEPQSFQYADNRFNWLELSQGPITVHWYEGNRAFGQTALSTAVTGLTQASLTLGLAQPASVNLYIYADALDAQEALQPSQHLWAEGRTFPDRQLAIVTVAPGLQASRDLERQLPHEVMHLALAQRLGAGYARLPNWLNEGLAVMNQAQPDPELASALAQAGEADTLFPLANLCGPFPADPVQAQLAYAESESVVRYIRRHFPIASLSKLLEAYAQGATCEAGVAQGLGVSQAEMEKAWLADLAAPARTSPPLPWAILAAVVLAGGGVLAVLARGGRSAHNP